MNNLTIGDSTQAITAQELSSDIPTATEEETPKNRRWSSLGGLLTISIFLLLGGRVALQRSSVLIPLREANQAELLQALTVPVTHESLAIRVEGSGSVISKDTVNLSPITTGRLATLYVDQGEYVNDLEQYVHEAQTAEATFNL